MFRNDFIADPMRDMLPPEEAEIWVQKSPMRGDHIRVKRGLYNHHGIYVSDDEVIHFTGQGDDDIFGTHNEVLKSDLAFFLKDGTLEVKEYTDDELRDLYPVEGIVSYARSCIGDNGYNVLLNNCEHFANVCTLGKHRSKQVENILWLKDKRRRHWEMGLIGDLWDGVKSIFGGGSSSGGGSRSTSSTSTTYEPDKVKIAEIEAENKIRLARMEQDKVALWRDVQKDLLRADAEAEEIKIQARAKGFMAVAQAVATLQMEMHRVAKTQLIAIEESSLTVIKEMEEFYGGLVARIKEDRFLYSSEQYPKLLSMLEKYKEGTTEYNMYKGLIDRDQAMEVETYTKQITDAIEGSKINREAILKDKERILGTTDKLLTGMVAKANIEIAKLKGGAGNASANQLTASNKPLELEEGKK